MFPVRTFRRMEVHGGLEPLAQALAAWGKRGRMEYVSRISGVCGGRIAFSDWYGYTKSMENEKAIPGGRVDGSGNREVRGTWRFSGEHPLFDEHFPGAPRVPGTLVIEAMRAGAEALFPGWRVLGVKRFRFRHFIEPGAYDYAFTPQSGASCCPASGGWPKARSLLRRILRGGRHEVAFQRAGHHYGGKQPARYGVGPCSSGGRRENAFRLPFVRRARTLRGSGAFLPSPR